MALEEEFSNTQVKWAQLDNNKSFFSNGNAKSTRKLLHGV